MKYNIDEVISNCNYILKVTYPTLHRIPPEDIKTLISLTHFNKNEAHPILQKSR